MKNTRINNYLSSLISHLSSQKGQTLLIVVLVMVVSLTVALSVASRSITNLRTATEEENSQRAFSAAEAGVERALKTLCSNPPCEITGGFTAENNADFAALTTNISGTEFLLNNGNPIFKDDGIDVWLINHNTNDSLNFSSGWQLLTGDAKVTVYWGTSTDSCALGTVAAIEIIVMSGSPSNPVTKRYGIDPCPTRRSSNNFSPDDTGGGSGGSSGGKNFPYRTTIDIRNTSKGILVRIIPLYANVPIAVKGCNFSGGNCNPFPAQGKKIESTGKSGGTARKITYFQGYPKLPSEFFQYILFSP